ncbi:MAG: hypothetical protein WCR72_00100 [Bacteroidota bacterium]
MTDFQSTMKVISLILLFFMLAEGSYAQGNCTDESIMALKGKWIKNTAYDAGKAKSPEAVRHMDKMVQLLQSAYELAGTEAKYWYDEKKDASWIKNTAFPYSLNADFMEYYCNSFQKTNNLKLGNETGDWFFIWANTFGRFAMLDQDFMIENRQVYQLTPQLGELDGFPLFAGADGNELQGSKQFSRTILVSRTGQLPYTPVSRKQYLLAFLKYREESYKVDVAYETKRPVRSDAEEEEAKKQGYDKADQFSGPDQRDKDRAKSNYLRFYVSDKEEHQNALTQMEATYRKDIKPAEDFLDSQPAEELSKPALLKPGNHKNDFKIFENEPKGRMLVAVNENYFTKQPGYNPQFFAVYWMWGGNSPGTNFGLQVEKNFDFRSLQQMLDK